MRCPRIAQGCIGFMIHKQKIEIFKNKINIVQLAVDSKKNIVRHEPLTREASTRLHVTDSVDPKFCFYCSSLTTLVGR